MCKDEVDVVFLVDNSATISKEKYGYLLDFIVDVVNQLDYHIDSGKVRVALITFSDTPVVRFRLPDYASGQDVAYAIRNLPYSGYETDTAAAITELLKTDFFK